MLLVLFGWLSFAFRNEASSFDGERRLIEACAHKLPYSAWISRYLRVAVAHWNGGADRHARNLKLRGYLPLRVRYRLSLRPARRELHYRRLRSCLFVGPYPDVT